MMMTVGSVGWLKPAPTFGEFEYVGAGFSRPGRSHGGATIRSPTRIALRPACERAAQSSSGTSTGRASIPGKLARNASAARSRSPSLWKKNRDSSMAARLKSIRKAWTRSSASDGSTSRAGQVCIGAALLTTYFSTFPLLPLFHLPEDVLHAVEDATLVVLGARRRLELLLRHRRGELLEQFPLLLGRLLRCHDLDGDEQVAARPAGDDVRHAAPAQPEGGAALCALGHLERLLAFERGNGDLAAERRRRIGQRDFAVQIVAVAVKERMVLHVDDDVEIAGRAAAAARFALAAQAQALPARDAGGDLHRQLALVLHAAGATARGAGRADDRARSAALSAGARDREEALLVAQLASPVALRARLGLRPGRRARPVARLARLLAWNLDRRLHTLGGFVERDLEVVPEVDAALRAAAPALPAEHLADAKYVAETAEDVLEAGENRRVEPAGRRATQPRVAEAVVHVALVGVG